MVLSRCTASEPTSFGDQDPSLASPQDLFRLCSLMLPELLHLVMRRHPIKVPEGLVQPSRRTVRPILVPGQLAIELGYVNVWDGGKDG